MITYCAGIFFAWVMARGNIWGWSYWELAMSETFSGAFDGVTRILKGTENPGEAWGKMVALFREVSPDAMWDTLPAPDLEGDIERAVAWLGLHWKPSPRQQGRGV
mgnify:CR=1 FL=1